MSVLWKMRPGHAEVVLPDAVVVELPGRLPVFGDLGGLAVGGGERSGAPVGAETAEVVALRLEAPLDDIGRVEPGLGRVLAGLVDRQQLRDLVDVS